MAALIQLALNNRLKEVCAALDAEPTALDRCAVGGLFDGRTLLMCAAARGHEALVRELLRRGADPSVKDKRGATAESLARRQGHTQLAEAIASNATRQQVVDDEPQPPSHNDPAVQRFIATASASGIKVEPGDADGAVGGKRARVVESESLPPTGVRDAPAANKRARVLTETPIGLSTSLVQLALNNRLKEVCAALDAEPTALDRCAVGGLFDGRTLLMCAAARGHEALVRELLRRGADPSVKDKRGATAESLARRQGHTQLAEVVAFTDYGTAVSNAGGLCCGSDVSSNAMGKRPRDGANNAAASPNSRPRAQHSIGASPPPTSEGRASDTCGVGQQPSASQVPVPKPTPSPAPPAPSSSSSSSTMTIRVHLTERSDSAREVSVPSLLPPPPSLLLHSVTDADATTVEGALLALGRAHGVRLRDACNAKGALIDASAAVFTCWLDHGDASGNFETDLSLWCKVIPTDAEAQTIFDLLEDDD